MGLFLENVPVKSVSVCVSLMKDNSSFYFGSVFVSDYTFVFLSGCALGVRNGKGEGCGVIKCLIVESLTVWHVRLFFPCGPEVICNQERMCYRHWLHM